MSNTLIDNQLLTKMFCSLSGDRLFVLDEPAGKRKDCGSTRKPYPAHSACQVRNPRVASSLSLPEPLQPPSMSSWVFACPHQLQLSQGSATSRGKSMTLQLTYHFQRRLCSCADSLIGIRTKDLSADPVVSNDVVFFNNYWQMATHSSCVPDLKCRVL